MRQGNLGLRAGLTLIAAMLALLLTAGPTLAQGRAAGQGRGTAVGGARGAGPMLLRDSFAERGPIELLLARSDSFQLSHAQIRSLQTLATRLRQQNAPLIQGVLDARREVQPLIGTRPRDMTPEQREQFARQAARARPLLQQIQRNNVSAMAQVSELLTPPQKRNVRRWLNESGLLNEPGVNSRGEPERQRKRWQRGRDSADVW